MIEENLPTSSKIYVTAENNSYGIIFTKYQSFRDDYWTIRNVLKTTIDKHMFKMVNLKPIQHNYMTTSCIYGYDYGCIGKIIKARLKESSSQCSMVSLPSLPLCKIDKNFEEEKVFWNAFYSYGLDKCWIKFCSTLAYSAEEINYEKYSDTEITFRFGYTIDSNSTTINEEYLVWDGINTIGSVGGTLGMCIGFSFTGLISSLKNILKHLIFIMQAKFANRNLPKQNEISTC